jgi:hypothetical protein
MQSDQELRERALKRAYELRHEKGWQRLPEALEMSDVPEHVLGNIVAQLRDRGLVKWHRTMGGECRGAIEITSAGIDEIESLNVPIPPIEILGPQMASAHPTHTLISWFAFIAGIFFGVLGVVLVGFGSSAKTSIRISDFNISTESVGIAAIALGVILILFTFRRILESVERLQK